MMNPFFRSLFASMWVLFVAGVSLVPAQGLLVTQPPESMPDLRTVLPTRMSMLEMQQHHVTVRIDGQIAVTTVDQVFRNPTGQRLEATYFFPVPKGGRLDSFAMEVDGKMVEAELLDAGKARQIYEEIVRKALDPALLEYAGRDLIKVRIFPIEPGSTKPVKLRYTQLLSRDGNLVRFAYPLNTEKFSASPVGSMMVKVEVSANQPITTIYSPTHTIDVTRPNATKAVIGFEVNNARSETDFELFFSAPRKPGKVEANEIDLALLTFHEGLAGGQGGYFLLLASAPWKAPDTAAISKDVLFVVDTSGSMQGDKIKQAQRALLYCLRGLNKGDRFGVVGFATEAQAVFDRLVSVDEASRSKAEAAVAAMTARGGTAIEAALQLTMQTVRERDDKGRPMSVVFLTDGQPTVGARDVETLLRVAQKQTDGQNVRVFTFGIGSDVNTHLLDRLAQETKAVSQYVLPSEDIEVKVSSFFARISNPVLTNVKLEVDGVKVSQLYPQVLPDLFEGDQLVVVGRYSGSGSAKVTLNGQSHERVQQWAGDVKFEAQNKEHHFIAGLWATRRVGYLLDQVRLHGESEELKDEITRLARQFGIVTPYTAYLIVEDEAKRNVPVTIRALQNIAAPSAAPVREELRRAAVDMRERKVGDDAVANAQLGASLQAATAPASVAQKSMSSLGERAVAGSGAAAELARDNLRQSQQQMRVVRGQMFYQNGSQWIDARVPAQQNAKKVQVVFNSDEYFALLRKHPEVGPWLALGVNVQFILADTVYEVVAPGAGS